MKNNTASSSAIGGSSLLVIFAVLCLTVFTMLALTTAQAEERLADSAVNAVADYYRADTRAEEIFAALRSGQMPEGVTEQGGIYSYVCPISEKQDLYVVLREQQGLWEVLRWQAVARPEITNDDTPSVWNGF